MFSYSFDTNYFFYNIFQTSYKTCRFSQDLDLLMSFIHIFCKISLAILRLKLVFDPCNLLFSFFKFDFFLSRDSLNRICLRMPTRSSSTLCCIPLEVSMNLQSLATARALPSEGNKELS